MRSLLVIVLLSIFSWVSVQMAASDFDKEKGTLSALLPQDVSGWKPSGEDAFYDRDSIFDYIDGAGEVYRSYDFRLLLSRRYEKTDAANIVVDLFDMGLSRNAFGVFTHDPEGEPVGVGQGSTYKGGLLSFWRGKYFVSLYAEEESEETRAVLISFGREISEAVREDGKKPEIVDFIPDEFLSQKELHYFTSPLILNYHFFISEENLFHLDGRAEAVLAARGEGMEKERFLLIRYPDAGSASEALESFIAGYMPDSAEPGLVMTENRKWTAARANGVFLAALFDAASAERARDRLEKVFKSIVILD